MHQYPQEYNNQYIDIIIHISVRYKNNICWKFISKYDDECLRVDNLKDKVGTYGK